MKNLTTQTPNLTHPANLSRLLAIGMAAILLTSAALQAQPILVPNGSFETPSTGFVTNNFDSWQRPAKPDYFNYVEQNFGILWGQTAGIFAGGTYGNLHGSQAAYLFSFPQVGLFQDYDTMNYNNAAPTHAFDATYQVGNSYTFTLGVFGKGFAGNMTEGSMLGLSLYYRNGDTLTTIGAPTIITYTAAGFPNVGALNLVDYSVSIPTVQAGDAWAGQHIGIKIESIYGTGDGYWDIDNVRLTAVPEPAAAGLLIGGGLLLRLLRSQDRRAAPQS